MKICIARLRSGANFTDPLNDIIDSFYYLLEKYVKAHPEHEYSYYNFGFGVKPKRNIDAIKSADIIIIPSEAEFTYHIPGAIHTLDLKASNQRIEELKPFINNKKVIILRSDRRDNEELYATRTFKDLNVNYQTIDEIDFGNVHGMKYHFIKDINHFFDDNIKLYDFAYWGSDKRKTVGGELSGDVRHTILKQIYKNPDIKSYFIGRFYGFDRNQKWAKMKDIVPILKSARSTLCFNWMDASATTSRYIEAVACGMIPFVWQNYDTNNVFVENDWQRVNSYEEFLDKVSYIQYNENFNEKFKAIENKFLNVLKTPEEYYSMFEKFMEEKINA